MSQDKTINKFSLSPLTPKNLLVKIGVVLAGVGAVVSAQAETGAVTTVFFVVNYDKTGEILSIQPSNSLIGVIVLIFAVKVMLGLIIAVIQKLRKVRKSG